MIIDPVSNGSSKWLGAARVMRGVYFSTQRRLRLPGVDLPSGDHRAWGDATRGAAGRGLRLSQTLPCNGDPGVVE